MTQSVPVKLYVGNLAEATTENGLRQLFSQAGKVTTVHLVRDLSTGEPEGHAFVTMTTAAGAQKAIAAFQAATVAEHQLIVHIADQSMSTGFQSRLDAFGATDRGPKTNRLTPGQSGGGYQSKLGAFGTASRPPTQGRRRGGNQRP